MMPDGCTGVRAALTQLRRGVLITVHIRTQFNVSHSDE
jgi:hypothetical protein